MQLVQEFNRVESTFGTPQRLQIKATAAAMEVLSKKLYSRPVEAVLRELGTNAADSHTDASFKEKPFEVHLPTYQNQTLRVRDYGLGIHPDKVVDIFATYFSSSKTNDNSTTGCLGLGSKSPLAISDQFTVEIWHEGFYYVWSILKDEEGFAGIPDGKPSLVQPTTEPTGVQITVPVSEFRYFETTAIEVYQRFTPIPNVYKGQNKLDIKRPECTSYTSFYLESGSGIYALMGNVLYPINPDIKGLECYKGMGSNSKLVIPFEIGELSFAASREELEYTKLVILTLKNKFVKISKEMSIEVQVKIDEEKNAYQAYLFFKHSNLPNSIRNEIEKTITYKGKLLSSYYPNDRTNYDESMMKDKTQFPLLELGYSKKNFQGRNSFNIGKNIRVYYNDDNASKGLIRKMAYLSNQTNSNNYLLSSSVDIDKWLELNFLTRENLFKTSEVILPKTEYSYEYRGKAGLFKVRGGEVQKDFWKKLDEAPDFGYYVQKIGDKMVIGGKEVFPQFWDSLMSLGILPAEVYGISKTSLKHYPDWELLEDYVKPLLEAKRKDLEFALANSGTNATKLIPYWHDGEFKSKLLLIRNHSDIFYWSRLYELFNQPLVYKKELKIEDEYDEILVKYPLLAKIIDPWKYVSEKDVKNYITALREKESLQ